jgi:uncharacterized protein
MPGAVAIWVLAERFRPRVAPDCLRRLPEGAQEGSAHPFAIGETRFRGNDIDRVPALLHHQPGRFKAKMLDGLRRRPTGLGVEGTAELARAEVCRVRELFDGECGAKVLFGIGKGVLNPVGFRVHLQKRRVLELAGRSVETIAADLTDPAGLATVERVLKTDASITLLVNNAGFGGPGALLQSDVDNMTHMIALNATAVMRLTYAVVPGPVARGGGTIINIASIVAIGPEILNGVYGGTKAFVLAFSQSLRHELTDKNMRVHVVAPGATETEFWEKGGVPVQHLPKEIVTRADDMVDAALAGLDQGEFLTIPSLPDAADWDAYEAARQKLLPNLSHSTSAARYGVASKRATAT